MYGMFYEASSFNQDLSPWIVDKVTTMELMFYKATSYTHTLCGHAWLESTADQTNMFLDAGLKAKIGAAPCSCGIGKALTIPYDNSAAVDCDDHYSENAKSGKYEINPGGVGAFDVYCDFDRNDGPWTGK
jgi:surface protein